MAVVDYDNDNLITGTKSLNTQNKLQLESGQSVVRGEVLKAGTTGVVAVAATSDSVLCVALQTIDATSEAKDIAYTNDCSLDARELKFGAGDMDDFRISFMQDTRILVEGDL